MMSARRQGASSPGEEELLAVAVAIVGEEGIDALTVRRVAEAAETSTMSIYTRFGGKSGLVAALRVEGFRRFAAAVSQPVRSRDPLRALSALAEHYRRWALDNPIYYELIFGGRATTDRVPPAGEEAAVHSFVVLVEAVKLAQQADRLRAGDPWRLAHVLWGFIHGHVSLELAGMLAPAPPGQTWPDPAVVFRDALEVAMKGLAPTTEGSSVPSSPRSRSGRKTRAPRR